jgi:hypothetical protein
VVCAKARALTKARAEADKATVFNITDLLYAETPHWALPANVAARPIIGNLQNVFSACLSDIRHARSK